MKQAVVYIIDASATMQSCPLFLRNDDNDSGDDDVVTAPWELAQRHVLHHFGALLQHGAANVASIIACRTTQTYNHKCVIDHDEDDDDSGGPNTDNTTFGHLHEFTFGLTKTSVETMRQFAACGPDTYDGDDGGGGGGGGTVLDALRLAAVSLEEATAGKKFGTRHVYVYTDTAGHDYEMGVTQLSDLVKSLQSLECAVHVISFPSVATSNEGAVTVKSEPVAVKQEHSSLEDKHPNTKMETSTHDAVAPPPVRSNNTTAVVKKQETKASKNDKEDDNSVTDDEDNNMHASPVKSNMRVKRGSNNDNDDSETDDDDDKMHAPPVKSHVRVKQETSSDTDDANMHASPVKSTTSTHARREALMDTDDDDDDDTRHDAAKKRIKTESNDDDNNNNPLVKSEHRTSDSDDVDDDEEEDVVVMDSRQARNEFLQSLAAQTNGTYRVIHRLSDLFGPGTPSSLDRADVEPFQKDPHYAKTTLLLTPAKGADLSQEPYAIPVRLSLRHAKQGPPTLKRGAVREHDHNDNHNNDIGQSNSDKEIRDTEKLTRFVQLDDPDGPIYNPSETTKAIRYGSEWKVIDATFDHATVPSDMPGPALQLIGVMERERLPAPYVSGPCHVVTGHDSLRACAAVTALATALRDTDKVGLVLCAKTKSTVATTLGALLPSSDEAANRLYMVTLPYAGEVKTMAPEDWRDDDADEQVAADLIDALWLSDEQADAILHQADPFQRAVQTTLLQRAVHPCCSELFFPRRLDDHDPLGTPPDVKAKARGAVTQFRDAFPLVLKPSQKEKKKQGQKAPTYSNFLPDKN